MNVLILTSSNRNFPIDIHQEITKAGQNAIRFTQLADFFSSPLRQRPYLAILEIGNPEDVQRGILAYEWTHGEEIPCRFLLLLSSKYLQLGEKALRFAGTETAVLPMASKNLLFKIELQLKLLLSDKPKMPTSTQVFRADVSSFERQRVLKLKGPNPFEGKWNRDHQTSPSGKIRWRWVRTHASENTDQETSVPNWTLESDTAPVYLPQEKIWQITDSSANLLGHFGEEEIYSWKSFLEKQGIYLDDSSAIEEGSKKQEDNQEANEKRTLPAKDSAAKNAKSPNSLKDPIETPKEAKGLSEKESSQKHRSIEESDAVEKESHSEKLKHSLMEEEESQKQINAPSDSTQKELEGRKKSLAQQETIDEINPKKKERAGSSLLAEEVSAPGEDQTERSWSTEQEQALPGALDSHKKKAKYAVDDLTSSLKQKKQSETLSTEQASPSQAEIAEEELLGKMKKKEFEIQEKQKRSILQQQVEIEGSHRSDRKNEFIQEDPSANPRHTIEEGLGDNPSLEEIFSRPQKGNEKPDKERKEESIEPKPEKQIKRDPISEESFQSAAKSYGRDKEISKKIVMDPQKPQEKEGKIEVEIPAAPQLLELEKRIAPSPALLETEQKFSKDKPAMPLESDFLKIRHFEILTLKQLDDDNSSWHPVDQFRVYLKAKHRYYGVKDVRDIFPLWIYSGELAPEFLEKEESWKFYDRPPKKYLIQDALPVAVARFIQKLAQISGENQIGTSDVDPTQFDVNRTGTVPEKNTSPQLEEPEEPGESEELEESPRLPDANETDESAAKKNSKKRGVLGFFRNLFEKK